jgi:hypothetical protein
VGHNAYSEYIPATQEAAAAAIATQMCQDIAARAGGPDPVAARRSTYQAKPSGAGLYVTSGAVDDFCFSRWFAGAAAGRPIPPVVALTMESGGDPRKGPDAQDGEFWPDYRTQYPKIEREIHAAVWSFLTQIAATPVTGPITPPPPMVATTLPPKKGCLVATTLYRDPGHPSVVFLRDVRDRQLLATGVGRRFAARLTAGYDLAAPPLAGWFARHPAVARITRVAVVTPFVRALQAVSAATARWPLARSVVLSSALGAVASPAIAVLRALDRAPTRHAGCPQSAAVRQDRQGRDRATPSTESQRGNSRLWPSSAGPGWSARHLLNKNTVAVYIHDLSLIHVLQFDECRQVLIGNDCGCCRWRPGPPYVNAARPRAGITADTIGAWR